MAGKDKKSGIISGIAGVLTADESVIIVEGGRQRTITATRSKKSMASTKSLNDVAGIKGELITGKHSVHRKAKGEGEVELSGMPKSGGTRGSVVFSTAEYLRHCAKEVTLGLNNGSFFTDSKGAIMLAKHLK